MGRIRSMTPGGTGFTYGANTVGNQGGGNKKQGLPPTIGRAGWLSNFIRSNSGGYFRGIPAAGGPVDPCPTKEVGAQTVSTQAQADALKGVTKIIIPLPEGPVIGSPLKNVPVASTTCNALETLVPIMAEKYLLCFIK